MPQTLTHTHTNIRMPTRTPPKKTVRFHFLSSASRKRRAHIQASRKSRLLERTTAATHKKQVSGRDSARKSLQFCARVNWNLCFWGILHMKNGLVNCFWGFWSFRVFKNYKMQCLKAAQRLCTFLRFIFLSTISWCFISVVFINPNQVLVNF